MKMTKEASARYTSKCSACGGTINPGQMISYDPAVKYSSRHKVCPTTVVHSKEPLNSPGRAALQGRGRSDKFWGEKTDIVIHWTSESRPGEDDLGKVIHDRGTKRDPHDRFLTCVGTAGHWVSQDEADDFDLVHAGSFQSHWSITRYYRLATDAEAAPLKAREAELAQKQAVEAALKAFEQRVRELGADLQPAYSNRIETRLVREGMVELRRWSTAKHPSYSSPFYRGVYAVQLADGRLGYRFVDSYYDWPQDFVVVVEEFFADEPPVYQEVQK